MPCTGPSEVSNLEKEISNVYFLIDEIDGTKCKMDKQRGAPMEIYKKGREYPHLNKVTAKLCSKLKGKNITKYSLEMQLWWRNHQEWDRKREQEENKEEKKKSLIKSGLTKLSKEEKIALGLIK